MHETHVVPQKTDPDPDPAFTTMRIHLGIKICIFGSIGLCLCGI